MLNPRLAQRAMLLCNSAYAVLAFGVTKGAIWSAEHLTADMVAAARDTVRASEFFADRLPAADQARNEDYRGSGFDRGHMTPSGEMPDGDAQQQSFSLPNMMPQSPRLNRGVWAGIEIAVGWLGEQWFSVPFTYWKRQLEERRDVFLGYCSNSEGTAANLKRFIETCGATVLDWQTDFIVGRSILEQIHAAAARCSANVFLFTKDDNLIDYRQPNRTAPRDNVALEAAYFIALKGKRNILIVREEGCEMPADLGGDVYARLRDKTNIGPIERIVSTFVAAVWRRGRRYVSCRH